MHPRPNSILTLLFMALAMALLHEERSRSMLVVGTQTYLEYRGTGYVIVDGEGSRLWASAQTYCRTNSEYSVQGNLLKVGDVDVWNYMVTKDVANAFMGLRRETGGLKWRDGTTTGHFAWAMGHPSATSDCGIIDGNKNMAFQSCVNHHSTKWICSYDRLTVTGCNPYCNYHGSATLSVNSGSSFVCTCACRAEYSGTHCDSCAPDLVSYPHCIACTSAGYCNGNANSTEASGNDCSCACNTGYNGTRCDKCANGFAGYPNCTRCNATDVCNSHAVDAYTVNNTCACKCASRYKGAACDECAHGVLRYPACETPTATVSTSWPTGSHTPSLTAVATISASASPSRTGPTATRSRVATPSPTGIATATQSLSLLMSRSGSISSTSTHRTCSSSRSASYGTTVTYSQTASFSHSATHATASFSVSSRMTRSNSVSPASSRSVHHGSRSASGSNIVSSSGTASLPTMTKSLSGAMTKSLSGSLTDTLVGGPDIDSMWGVQPRVLLLPLLAQQSATILVSPVDRRRALFLDQPGVTEACVALSVRPPTQRNESATTTNTSDVGADDVAPIISMIESEDFINASRVVNGSLLLHVNALQHVDDAMMNFSAIVPLLHLWRLELVLQPQCIARNDGRRTNRDSVYVELRSPPLSKPTPVRTLQEVLPPAQTAVEVTTVAASLTGVNPALATQTTLLSALRAVDLCAADPSANAEFESAIEDPEVAEHPLRFGLSSAGEKQQYMAGSVVGNVVVFAIVAVLALVVAAPLRLVYGRSRVGGPPTFYVDAVAWSRFPGLLAFPVAFLLPEMAAVSVLLLARPASATGAALGVVGAVVSIAALVGGTAVFAVGAFSRNVQWAGGSAATTHTKKLATDDETTSKAAGLVIGGAEKLAVLLDSDGQWTVRDESWFAEGCPRGRQYDATGFLMRMLGMFIEAYRETAPWFLVFEVVAAAGIRVVTLLIPLMGCRVAAWLMLVLYVGFLAALVYLRPHACQADRVIYPLLLGAQTLVTLLAVVTIEVTLAQDDAEQSDRDGDVLPREVTALQEMTNGLLAVIASFGALLALYEVGKIVYLQLLARARERRRARQEDENAVAVQGGARTSAPQAALLLLEETADVSPASLVHPLLHEEASPVAEDDSDKARLAVPPPARPSVVPTGAKSSETETAPAKKRRQAAALVGGVAGDLADAARVDDGRDALMNNPLGVRSRVISDDGHASMEGEANEDDLHVDDVLASLMDGAVAGDAGAGGATLPDWPDDGDGDDGLHLVSDVTAAAEDVDDVLARLLDDADHDTSGGGGGGGGRAPRVGTEDFFGL